MKYAPILLMLTLWQLPLASQMPTPSSDAYQLTGVTTPVEVEFVDAQRSYGSGFFYMHYAPEETPKEGSHWRTVEKIFLVTAKHVLQLERFGAIRSLEFAMRENGPDNVKWHRIKLSARELSALLRISPKPEVDVAVIDVTDSINKETMKTIKRHSQLLMFPAANPEEVPGKSPIEVQAGDDVVIVGYPLGLFDQFNKLPILKTGLLNTPLGLRFNGMDAFLIDLKYYEGMSGALIVSKPTHFSFTRDKHLQATDRNEYLFLGVYQGEYYGTDTPDPQRADLGLGWYYYNVEEAINNALYRK